MSSSSTEYWKFHKRVHSEWQGGQIDLLLIIVIENFWNIDVDCQEKDNSQSSLQMRSLSLFYYLRYCWYKIAE